MNIKIFLYTPIISLIVDISRSFGFYYNKLKKVMDILDNRLIKLLKFLFYLIPVLLTGNF